MKANRGAIEIAYKQALIGRRLDVIDHQIDHDEPVDLADFDLYARTLTISPSYLDKLVAMSEE